MIWGNLKADIEQIKLICQTHSEFYKNALEHISDIVLQLSPVKT